MAGNGPGSSMIGQKSSGCSVVGGQERQKQIRREKTLATGRRLKCTCPTPLEKNLSEADSCLRLTLEGMRSTMLEFWSSYLSDYHGRQVGMGDSWMVALR